MSYYAFFQGWLLLGKPPVSAPLPPLSLSSHFGVLASDLDCFPLDDEAYPPSSHLPTLTPVVLRSKYSVLHMNLTPVVLRSKYSVLRMNLE